MSAPEPRLFPLRIVAIAIGRMRWRGSGGRLGDSEDKATIARTLAWLFGFGAILLLFTLLLPGSAQREPDKLMGIAAIAVIVAGVLIGGYERLPLWFLKAAPSLGTVLVCLVVIFAGPSASPAYAMYLAWVVIAAGCFFSTRLTALHGGIALGAYWAALEGSGYVGPVGLSLAMTAGTAAVAAGVMGGLSSQARELLAKLEDAALTDPLTGLLNRRALADAFERELARATRTGRPLGLIVIDVDDFKSFNDHRGHPAGDVALRRVAAALDESSRAIDTVARMGGEEFAVLVPESDVAGTLVLADRLRRAIEIEFSGELPCITASCGVAAAPADGHTRAQLLNTADEALYEAKAGGRNLSVARVPEPAEPA